MVAFVDAFDIFLILADVSASDLSRIGGKAYNCGRLKQAQFPVPDGIVVPADASDDSIRALPRHPWLATAPPGVRFAVRSSGLGEDSAGHSFAGIHETTLNVASEQVVDAVFACRQSARSAQARAYRDAAHEWEGAAGREPPGKRRVEYEENAARNRALADGEALPDEHGTSDAPAEKALLN